MKNENVLELITALKTADYYAFDDETRKLVHVLGFVVLKEDKHDYYSFGAITYEGRYILKRIYVDHNKIPHIAYDHIGGFVINFKYHTCVDRLRIKEQYLDPSTKAKIEEVFFEETERGSIV